MDKAGSRIKEKYGSAVPIGLYALLLGGSGVASIYSIGVCLHFVDALIGGAAGISVAMLVVAILLKTLVTTTTLNWGGSGGLFPPIGIGAGLGYLFSLVFNVNLAVMFIAVGMAALLARPQVLLTAVAFVVETLGGVFAIPALLASGVRGWCLSVSI